MQEYEKLHQEYSSFMHEYKKQLKDLVDFDLGFSFIEV